MRTVSCPICGHVFKVGPRSQQAGIQCENCGAPLRFRTTEGEGSKQEDIAADQVTPGGQDESSRGFRLAEYLGPWGVWLWALVRGREEKSLWIGSIVLFCVCGMLGAITLLVVTSRGTRSRLTSTNRSIVSRAEMDRTSPEPLAVEPDEPAIERENPATPSRRSAEWEPQGTGIKLEVLLNCMNVNIHPDERLQHDFQLLNHKRFPDGDDVRIYEDKRSVCMLSVVGPEDDLTCVSLMMPLESLFKEDGEVDGEPVDAFGRCAKRMAIAVDPSWAAELHDWMKSQIVVALLTREGDTLTRRGLTFCLIVETYPTDKHYIEFIIGVPSEDSAAIGESDHGHGTQ